MDENANKGSQTYFSLFQIIFIFMAFLLLFSITFLSDIIVFFITQTTQSRHHLQVISKLSCKSHWDYWFNRVISQVNKILNSIIDLLTVMVETNTIWWIILVLTKIFNLDNVRLQATKEDNSLWRKGTKETFHVKSFTISYVLNMDLFPTNKV